LINIRKDPLQAWTAEGKRTAVEAHLAPRYGNEGEYIIVNSINYLAVPLIKSPPGKRKQIFAGLRGG